MFNLMLDPPTIIAITGLLSVIGNIVLTLDARRRSIQTAETVEKRVVPAINAIRSEGNARGEQLNGIAKGNPDAPKA